MKSETNRIICITCGKEFPGLNRWKSKNHSCIAALISQEDLRGFERDQLLDVEARNETEETRAKFEKWAFEKVAPYVELSRTTKAEVVSAYNSLNPLHKHAFTKHYEYTESELSWAESLGREEELAPKREILEEEKRVLLEAIKSVTRHILLLRGVNPRLIDVMVDIPDKQARKIAIRELLKSLK